ncbi:hypothetical protein JAAARDRAFT_128253 [Jaapia argillacea MUCL 33604]|uniref:Uncharacterized protein n=1 Tax=Jaapia argillacea MUCL 33604 TaxID=933084 RepID=A0A067Q732_9AGAM|nr:hypothetical protein JAAARDRAFT_128253 [Jaapia argillacea MUCL 33604]
MASKCSLYKPKEPSIPSIYTELSGTYVGSDSIDHDILRGKCWIDYYIVDQSFSYAAPVADSGEIDCGSTTSCTLAQTDGYKTCESWSEEFSAKIMENIFTFGAGVAFRYNHTLEKCSSASNQYSCGWTDGCHVIYSSQQIMTQSGYRRCRCHPYFKHTTTSWMEDYSHSAPTDAVTYSCADVPCTSGS